MNPRQILGGRLLDAAAEQRLVNLLKVLAREGVELVLGQPTQLDPPAHVSDGGGDDWVVEVHRDIGPVSGDALAHALEGHHSPRVRAQDAR